MQILHLKKNAKGSHEDWRITEKKKGQKMAENLKGRFWWGMCDNNDEKIQNGAVCAGENKKRESNSQRLREQ